MADIPTANSVGQQLRKEREYGVNCGVDGGHGECIYPVQTRHEDGSVNSDKNIAR
jgi:hypothetical protein